ncbi:MAG: glycerol kinase GlpK [Zoogloeaceae bacterium]|nr:glycerol kinase GlpK [Rhodocyclaceae bacterium]MCP5237457.1 glycerol kinase GlpK [Zoogloeaceae bacterium]
MPCLLALDQGTTSSRAMVFDEDSRVVAIAQKPFEQHFPRSGWVEHDAMEIWHSQLACAREALAKAGDRAGVVAGIGIANQRETTILWERASGRPVGPAIVWQDRRTAGLCDRLRAQGKASEIRGITGLELDAYFSATKLAWLLDNTPGARERAEAGELAFGTVDSWLIWQLTAGRCHVTDPGNASRTMLFDIHRQCWHDGLLELFDIPAALMPAVVDSSAVCGESEARLLGSVIPIAGIGGDQQAATFGQACYAPGMAKNTYGTGCFLVLNTGAAVDSSQRLLTTIGWRRQGRTEYMVEGSVFVAGAVVQWLRDGLGIIRDSAEVEALAASVPDSGGAVLVPAFTGLGAPWWDPRARGALVGLSRGSTAAHIARAALESIALQTVDLVDAMNRDASAPISELRVDGGAARNDLLMQIQADLLDVPVVRPRQTETTALGAAYLAGLAVGMWPGEDALAAHWGVERRFEPRADEDWRRGMMARWHKAVERARYWEED